MLPGSRSHSYPLNEFATVKLDGSGNGTASLGPQVVGQSWTVDNTGVQTSSFQDPAADVPQCSIYIGPAPIQPFFVDGTNTGSFDSTDRTSNYPVTRGNKVWAVWTNGEPNSTATVTCQGTVNS